MAMTIWRKDEKMYTALLDLMRMYLIHDYTPNIEQQLRQQFNEYFIWHEDNWERGHIALRACFQENQGGCILDAWLP